MLTSKEFSWGNRKCDVRFEIFTAVTMKNAVFWDIKTQYVKCDVTAMSITSGHYAM
jgi:hypothetical protein